ncbi:MAG: hypothetical protein HC945_03605, partial [Nitrosarchaeum sp.]|nr:hypothetical protein [Nitrosarchaeum sp.]
IPEQQAPTRPPQPAATRSEQSSTKAHRTQQTTLPQTPKTPPGGATQHEPPFDERDPFYKQIIAYFDEKKIKIHTKKLIRKNNDIEMTISIPTAIGRQDFFCKCKNKKKSNEGDLAAALLQGKLSNLPTLYLTTGEVTKKALEKLSSEYRGLTVKTIGS